MNWKFSIGVWNIFWSHLENIWALLKKISLSINNDSISTIDPKIEKIQSLPKKILDIDQNLWVMSETFNCQNLATKNWQLNFVNKNFRTLHTKNVIITQKNSIV
jgi:hypothetical protein